MKSVEVHLDSEPTEMTAIMAIAGAYYRMESGGDYVYIGLNSGRHLENLWTYPVSSHRLYPELEEL